MKQVSDRYIFPKYCQIVKLKGNKLAKLLQNEGVDCKYILVNRKTRISYFINESIINFLNLFNSPKTFNEVIDKVNISSEKLAEEREELISQFLDSMIKREFLVNENSYSNADKRIISDFPGYKILTILKDSKYGTICLGKDLNENSKVVLKFLNFYKNASKEFIEERRNCFKQEFDIMQKLSGHPLVCSVKSVNKKEFVAILEYAEGKSLKELIKKGKLKLSEKLIIIHQIIEVLSYIHQNEIIYGDIHANQFLIDSKLNVKLIDFSLSYYNNVNPQEQIIRRGGISYYIDPESVNPNAFEKINEYIPNFYSEVYRIGMLLYYLIYEYFPFESFSWKRLCKLIGNEPVKFDDKTSKGEQIPTNLLQVLEKSLQKEPSLRYGSALEIKNALKENM